MNMKAFRNIISGIICIALAFTLMVPAMAASQSNPEPLYDLRVYGDTISKYTENGEEKYDNESYSGYKTASKSLIYNDNGIVPHVVKIYDDHGEKSNSCKVITNEP